MDCDSEGCPVRAACERAKAEQVQSFNPNLREKVKKVLANFCPLEMAVEVNVSMVANEFSSYLKGKRRFEGKK